MLEAAGYVAVVVLLAVVLVMRFSRMRRAFRRWDVFAPKGTTRRKRRGRGQ